MSDLPPLQQSICPPFIKAKEMLGMRLCVLHNLYFYNTMMEEIRDAIDAGNYKSYKEEKLYGMNQINREKEAQI